MLRYIKTSAHYDGERGGVLDGKKGIEKETLWAMISQFNIIIATIIILMPFTQQLHKNNDNDNSDGDDDNDSVAKKATKKGSTSTDWLRNRELYVRQIDAITGSTHPRIECVCSI